MLGTRGIPARYGGFESCVEQIAVRLAARGHEITVYCRSDYPETESRSYRGVRLVHLPRLRKSFLESPFNSFIATVYALCEGHEVLHYFGCGNVPFLLAPRIAGRKVVLTVDGLEWKRVSYSTPAKLYLRSFAELATVFPNRLVADSASSERWYYNRTGVKPEHISYGAEVSSGVDRDRLAKFGLEENEYILFVGRLVREKGVHTLIEGFKSVPGNLRLVIVGDSVASDAYGDELRFISDERTTFLGSVFGDDYTALRNGALIVVHPTLLDGTSISLLSALASGRCILSSNLPENIDVAGDSAIYFKKGDPVDLASKLEDLLKSPSEIEEYGMKAMERAKELGDWDSITDSYETLYNQISKSPRI